MADKTALGSHMRWPTSIKRQQIITPKERKDEASVRVDVQTPVAAKTRLRKSSNLER